LKEIPNDGTFDQDLAVSRLNNVILSKGLTKVYSFDLTAATDRLPIDLQVGILDQVTGLPLGRFWKGLMVDRDFYIPPNTYKIPSGFIRYSVGQPMGALSSWAMLAITHH
jgi:hypothetical protein